MNEPARTDLDAARAACTALLQDMTAVDEPDAEDNVEYIRSHIPRFAARFASLIAQAHAQGVQHGISVSQDQLGWACNCRCIAHHKVACPRCLNVWGCPAHVEPDRRALRPEFLEEPEQVARALVAQMRGTMPAWEELTAEQQGWWIDAVRNVVSVRLVHKEKT